MFSRPSFLLPPEHVLAQFAMISSTEVVPVSHSKKGMGMCVCVFTGHLESVRAILDEHGCSDINMTDEAVKSSGDVAQSYFSLAYQMEISLSVKEGPCSLLARLFLPPSLCPPPLTSISVLLAEKTLIFAQKLIFQDEQQFFPRKLFPLSMVLPGSFPPPPSLPPSFHFKTPAGLHLLYGVTQRT